MPWVCSGRQNRTYNSECVVAKRRKRHGRATLSVAAAASRECCEFLGPHGVDAVQISPPMEDNCTSMVVVVSARLTSLVIDWAMSRGWHRWSRHAANAGSNHRDAVTNHMASGAGTDPPAQALGRLSGHTHRPTFTTTREISHELSDHGFTDRRTCSCVTLSLAGLDSSADWPRHRLGAYLGCSARLASLAFE